MRFLTDLITPFAPDLARDPAIAELRIDHITADSRDVREHTLFVAIPGTKLDGSQFISQAVENGAIVIISSSPFQGEGGVRVNSSSQAFESKEKTLTLNLSLEGRGDKNLLHLHTNNPRLALAKLAAAFYPRQPAHIAAVTGTDGKTSTADFTRQLWELLGHKAASMGTLGIKGEGGRELYPGTHTTPDPVTLHRILQELADAGYTHLAMEASSHGLDQYRLHGVKLQAAAFTNLTRDHLDYHGTEEAYFAAKQKLFTELLPEQGVAVLNADDRHAHRLKDELCQERSIIAYGHRHYSGASIRHGITELILNAATSGFYELDQNYIINDLTPLPHGQRVSLTVLGREGPQWLDREKERLNLQLEIPLVGNFQIFNMLAACGLVQGCGETQIEKLIEMLPQLKGVLGRLEPVAVHDSGAGVYIDYAHTPAALENVLKTLRPHVQRRLHVVFGCGGDRDKGKRPLMVKAAAEHADYVIVTDDNPRSEPPALIRAEVMAGVPDSAKNHVKEVAGRKEAIYAALHQLEAGDILLVAGKGHEKMQIIGNESLPFDDAEIIRAGVAELSGKRA